MSAKPEPEAKSPPQAAGTDLDYPRRLKELDERRRSADQVILRKMINPPDPHAPPRVGDA